MLRLGSGDVPGLRRAVGAAFGLDEPALVAAPGAPAPPRRLRSSRRRVARGLARNDDSLRTADGGATGSSSGFAGRARRPATSSTGSKRRRWRCSTRSPRAAGTPRRRPRCARRCWVAPTPASSACCASPRPRSCRGSAARPTSSTHIVDALNGRHVPAGPSGAPTRGRLDVLPTGRNFYSVDPRALPSELSYEVGCKLADALLERHRDDTGELPRMVGLVAWGTAAMRTQGDDVAEILALLGVRPTWHPESRRVTGIEVVPLQELGRPRIDVTVRISGFFRDAFPHLVALLDDAVGRVAALDEPDEHELRRRARARRRRAPGGGARRAARLAPRDDAHLRLEARHVRRRPPAAARRARLARRRRPRRRLRGVGRLRVRPRPRRRRRGRADARLLRADRRRREERRLARARHPRLRRLLPVPRRHDRDRPGAHRQGPGGVPRRQLGPLARRQPDARRGDAAGLPRPRRQPALDRVDDPPRLQGRGRAVGDRRLPLRLRRDGGRRGGLDVRAGRREVPARRGRRGVHGAVEPVGGARHRREAARSGRARAVGRAERATLDGIRERYLSLEGELEEAQA